MSESYRFPADDAEGAPYARRVEVIDHRRRGVAEVQDGGLIQSLGAGQRWDFRIGLRTDSFGRAKLLQKVEAHRRMHQLSGVFPLRVPQPLGATPPPSGIAIRLIGRPKAGVSEITIQRRSADRWDIPQGWYFKFPAHAKVYSVQEALELPALSTNYTLKFYPALRFDEAAQRMGFENVEAQVRWHPDMNDIAASTIDGAVFTFDAMFAEAV